MGGSCNLLFRLTAHAALLTAVLLRSSASRRATGFAALLAFVPTQEKRHGGPTVATRKR